VALDSSSSATTHYGPVLGSGRHAAAQELHAEMLLLPHAWATMKSCDQTRLTRSLVRKQLSPPTGAKMSSLSVRTWS